MTTKKPVKVSMPPVKKPFKKDPPALAKAEETLRKDLDGDQEKGESPAHRAKVLRKK